MGDATDEVPHAARPRSRKAHWPEGVYSISQDGLDWLGVDREGLLYWDGRLLKLTRKVTLATQERVLAWIVAGATVVAALATVVQAYAALAK